jgi:hypothetical protein
MVRLRQFATCLVLGSLAVPALAQDADSSIVVTGRSEAPPSSSAVVAQARAVTSEGVLRSEPLALMQDPLCPGVMGLKETGALAIIDRIRANALRLDIRLADETACTPNLIVAFVDDSRRQVNTLHDSEPQVFESLATPDRRALLAQAGPVHAWNLTETRTRDGMPVSRGEGLTNPPVAAMWSAHSKIYIPVRSDIVSSFLVLEREAVRGMTLTQLADYATMRGLAQTRPPEAGAPLDTILTLFDSEGPHPAEMTEFDSAYLAALYDSIPNMAGIHKLLGVNRQLRRQKAAATQPAPERE